MSDSNDEFHEKNAGTIDAGTPRREPPPLSSPSKKPRSSIWRVVRLALAFGGFIFVAGALTCLAIAWKPMGTTADGARLQRMEKSPLWHEGRFKDPMPRIEPDPLEIIPKWFGDPHPFRRPKTPLAHRKVSRKDFSRTPKTGVRITWLGHSTMIVEIGGKRLLIDPVWGEYVAPLEFDNAQRFIPPVLPFEELPPIDAVVISHDHYDHLDYPTILRLADMKMPFLVPLGVGAHLEYWGVPGNRIVEQNWWDEYNLGEVTIVCTPARHFSGRSLVDRDMTLWAGWAFIAPKARLFFSGDTALFPGFKEIGERYGPFDATMMESGAYNEMWTDVHLGPEQAVMAHKMLQGKLLIPVHWGMFDLGLHGWTEPMERILIAAEKENIQVATLRPGESVEPQAPPEVTRWWPKRPFDTVENAPAWSSGMGLPRN